MKSYAQAGQDLWVYEQLGDSGYFVDVGADDGVTHSNTYALERAGWTGLCVEPEPAAFATLCENRKASVTEFAATSDHHDVVIRPSGMRQPGRSLDWLLERAGAPSTIDYLSIDVEGHELHVLAGLDFNRWHVRLATIEHNSYLHGPAHKEAIAAVMTSRGFTCVADAVVAPGYGEYESWWVQWPNVAARSAYTL